MATEDPEFKLCQPVGLGNVNHSKGIFYGNSPLESDLLLLMVQISMINLITRIVMILLKPLKQPRVVSEIIGGIIIGPSVLGRNAKYMALMFPDRGVLLLKTIAEISTMYFVFVIAVQMNTSMIAKAGKKACFIGFCGVILPLILVFYCNYFLRNYLEKNITNSAVIWWISASLVINSSQVLFPILKELNILNSKVGRFAMSISMVVDVAGWVSLVILGSIQQFSRYHPSRIFLQLCSLAALLFFVFFVFRPAIMKIIRMTPVGKPVDQGYVTTILLVVLVSGTVCNKIGAALVDGPLMLGLAIPNGPPLGSTIVNKSETIIMEFFMPCLYVAVGLETNVFSKIDWVPLCSLFFVFLVGYLGKVAGTLLPSLYFNMSFTEALTLSLMMNLRGQAELFSFRYWKKSKVVLREQNFALAVLFSTLVTAITTPLIRNIYSLTKHYSIHGSKKRTLQHSRLDSEIRIVACIHDQDSVPGLINLLQASHSTKENPITVYALHLVELNGANARFIVHDKHHRSSKYARSNFMVNAFKIYEQTRDHYGSIHTFTAVSPYNTMYHDIWELALEKRASLIIVPFHKPGWRDYAQYNASHLVNSNLLAKAPCSVGILFDQKPNTNILCRSSTLLINRVAVLFMGGADAREALAFAECFARKPNRELTVVQFLLDVNQEYNDEEEEERKLDVEFMAGFRLKDFGNNQVVYREVMVKDGVETIKAIHEMRDELYGLWIMGRQQGMNPKLSEGISDWSDENPELGVIGDFVCSPDFGGTAYVLIVQQ